MLGGEPLLIFVRQLQMNQAHPVRRGSFRSCALGSDPREIIIPIRLLRHCPPRRCPRRPVSPPAD